MNRRDQQMQSRQSKKSCQNANSKAGTMGAQDSPAVLGQKGKDVACVSDQQAQSGPFGAS